MNNDIWKQERERLEFVLGVIGDELNRYENQTHHSWEKLQDELASYWEANSSMDEAQSVAAVGRERQLHALTYQKKQKFIRMVENPYFGRIDFLDDYKKSQSLTPEQFYIGIGTLIHPDSGEILIYDWRAPVCSMFYDYELGPAEYQSPAGLIKGELTLKRQYKIVNSHLEYMFDCDLKIDDEILQELLSKSVDEKMRTIVTSIQREQNRVIRDEYHRLLVVQGAAGSGKTSIALHRVAYLLYKDRKTITSQNILIFSPNRVFSDYISDVLPELGESNTPQLTFEDVIKKFKVDLPVGKWFESWAEQLEYLITTPEDDNYHSITAGIRFKSSPDFAALFHNYILFQEKQLFGRFPDITHEGRVIFSGNEWQNLWRKLSYIPPAQRLRQIRRRIYTKIRPMIKKWRDEEEAAIATAGEEVNETTIKAMARLAVWQNLQPLRDKIEKATHLNILEIYLQLYKNPELIRTIGADCLDLKQWQSICKQTLARFDGNSIPYEDVIPLLYLQGCFEGFPVDSSIRHLVIDEAQDYSVLQYQIIHQIFQKPTLTILGDLEQTVHPWLSITDFNQLTAIFGDANAENIRLLKSYRSTKEIMSFCRLLLPEHPNRPEVIHICRPGSKPTITAVSHPSNYWEIIGQTIQSLRDKYRSIAIICKSAHDAKIAYENLSKASQDNPEIKINLLTKEQTFFRQGITVIPVYLSKGLEFDAVLVEGISADKYYRSWERNLLYVACTRALHYLHLFYQGEISSLIPYDNPHLYLLTKK